MFSIASAARVATETPERYVTRLCKHFAHKTDAEWQGGHGEVHFSSGTCRISAETDTLVLVITAADAGARRHLEDVVARHLLTFAEGKEALAVEWAPVSAEAVR